MTSSNRRDGHRPAHARPVQTSVPPNRDVLEHAPGRAEARLGEELGDPPTTSRLESVGRPPAAGRLAWGRFIGRAEEIAALRAAIDAALGGQASLVMVAGEPGIGKTRLAEEGGEYARLRGAQVLVGRCYEGEAASPYSSFVEAIREYISTRPDDALKAEMGDGASDIGKLVPEIRKRFPDLTPSLAADPREERLRLFDGVTSFLVNASKANPIMLHLDDLHWADKPSLLLLQHLARRFKGSRLMVVGTYRDVELDRSHPLSAVLGELRRERLYQRVLLRGLSESEVKELIEAISQQKLEGPGEAFVRAVLRETEGNPFFIDEVLRHLVESGALYRREGRWVTAPKAIAEMEVPKDIRDVIGRRLARLSENTNRVLAAAAVLGREFEFDVLAPMTGLSEDEIVQAVDEALANQMVVETRGRMAPRYAFTHALVRQTLYEELSLPRRRQLHLKAAQAIEAAHERNLEPHITTLANHYRMVGAAADAEKTIDYSIRAGRAAFAVFAYEEAGAHWRAALDLMDEQGGGDRKRRAELFLMLGEALVSGGSKAVEYLEAAVPLFEELGDDQAACDVHSRIGLYLSTVAIGPADVRRAMPHFTKAEAFLAKQPESWRHALFYIYLASLYVLTMRIGDGLAASKRAMEISERLDEPFLRDVLWSNAGILTSFLLIWSGAVTEGLQLADQARRRADLLDDTMTGSTVAWVGGYIYYQLADPREAHDWATHELAKPRAARSAIRGRLQYLLTDACTEMGRLTEARAYLAEANAEEKPDEPLSFFLEAWILFFEGQWELADKTLTKGAELARTCGDRKEEWWGACALARVHRFTGERAKAVQFLHGALEIPLDEGEDILRELITRSELAAMADDAGDADEALPHIQRCRQIVAAGENWLGVAGFVERAEAVVAATQGEYSTAEAHFEKAIATFQRYCRPWDEADTLQYRGRALLAAGDPARAVEKFDAAIEIYRSRGAGARFIEYVMADKMRAQGATSDHAEVQPSPTASVNSNAPVGTHQPQAAPTGDPTSNDRIRGDSDVDNVFRKDGDFWTVTYGDKTFRLRNLKGFEYIAYLLTHPGVRIRARDLVAMVEGRSHHDPGASEDVARAEGLATTSDLGDAGEVLDTQAVSSYRRRLMELRAELAEAESNNDLGAMERARREFEELRSQLAAGVGRRGRARRSSSHLERARAAVTKNIRAGVERIRRNDAKLGEHFAASIRTGAFCAYLPDLKGNLPWRT